MATVTLHRRQTLRWAIPYWVFVNGVPVGIMQNEEMGLQLPPGQYVLGVKIVAGLAKWRLQIGGTRRITLSADGHLRLRITDRERWWNVLFNIDLALWVAKLFFELPAPWNMIYEVASNGFFVIWMIRIWAIRDRYLMLETED